MSIATPTWTSSLIGQAVFTPQSPTLPSWQRIPQIVTNAGFGFGQGGFGQGGFGGGQSQSGTPQPVWIPWTTD